MEKTLPVEGVDFEYVETDDPEVQGRSANPIVEILEGLYTGTLVQYGKIEFLIEDTPPRLAFDYVILDGGAFSRESLGSDASFKNLLGDIIIATVVKHEEERILINENRNNNPQVTD